MNFPQKPSKGTREQFHDLITVMPKSGFKGDANYRPKGGDGTSMTLVTIQRKFVTCKCTLC